MITAFVPPSFAIAKAAEKFQFERLGYLVAERVDPVPARPVFNLPVELMDSWERNYLAATITFAHHPTTT